MKVTAETVVPVVVAKESRKKNPDKKEFDNKMKLMDVQIEELRNKMRNIGYKKKEFIDGGTVGNTKVTFKDFLRDKIDAVREIKAAKRKVQDTINEIQEKVNKLEEDRQALRKNVSKDHQKPSEIQAQIEDLQKRYETTSLSKDNEKKIINEIKYLKTTLPSAQ